MAMANLKYLSQEEVKAVADPILKTKFGKFGVGDTGVIEEEDFDGAQIFRITATVSKPVPTKVLIDANDAIHQALRKKGDDRFVILATERPQAEDEVADEDID